MSALIYLCAVEPEQKVSIINGVQGSAIGDFTGLKKTVNNLSEESDYFLDQITGDLYQFNGSYWVARHNVGMHKSKAEFQQENQGQFFIRGPVYKPQVLKEKEKYLINLKEYLCIIKPQYMSHWLFDKIQSSQFIVNKENKWDIHPFALKRQLTNFQVLAETKFGPSIIIFGSSIVGIQFSLSVQCYQSIKIMQNFLSYCVEMMTKNIFSIPIE